MLSVYMMDGYSESVRVKVLSFFSSLSLYSPLFHGELGVGDDAVHVLVGLDGGPPRAPRAQQVLQV